MFRLFFDKLPMGVFITRHWQTSGGIVKESTVSTVLGRIRGHQKS